LSDIVPEVQALVSNVVDLMVVKAKSETDEVAGIADLCESNLKHIAELCGSEAQSSKDKKIARPKKKEKSMAPTEPANSRNYSKEGWISALSSVTAATLGALLQPRPQFPYGPAPLSYQHVPYNGGNAPM